MHVIVHGTKDQLHVSSFVGGDYLVHMIFEHWPVESLLSPGGLLAGLTR